MKRQGLTRDMYGKKTETELQRACGLGPGDEEKQIRGRIKNFSVFFLRALCFGADEYPFRLAQILLPHLFLVLE